MIRRAQISAYKLKRPEFSEASDRNFTAGDGAKWPGIYDLNKAVLGANPALIYPVADHSGRMSIVRR